MKIIADVRPEKAMLCFNDDGSCEIMEHANNEGRCHDYRYSLGACCAAWKKMTPEQTMQALVYLCLDACRQYGIPAPGIWLELLRVVGMVDYLERLENISGIAGGF